MLSYRHGFHAGNTADVFKHSVLFSFLKLYTQKGKAFTAFDLNGGSGVYDLLSEWSKQTGEAENGIIRLLKLYDEKKLPNPIPEDFQGYVEFCSKNYTADCVYYGSPEIIRSFLTPDSHLIITDLHPAEAENLKRRYKKIKNIHIHKRDCYEAVCALTPPTPVRGFVLFDPSYEVSSDYANIVTTIEKLQNKWKAGIFIVWYPVLAHRAAKISEFKRKLYSLKDTEMLHFEIVHNFCKLKSSADYEIRNEYGLRGSGMFIVNPPWGLEEKIARIAAYMEKLP